MGNETSNQTAGPNQTAKARAFPRLSVAIALLLTLAVIGWLGWQLWFSYRGLRGALSDDFRLQELRGTILRLDEVLTMSTRMAAATGEPQWEQRYRRNEGKLDEAIKEATRLAPEECIGEASAKTDAANVRLVAMENRAFEFVRQGQRPLAAEVLASAEYEQQKQIYAEGMAQILSALQRRGKMNLSHYRRDAYAGVALASAALPIVLFVWFNVFRLARKYVREGRRSEEELRRGRDFADSLIETAPVIVLILDAEGRIVRFNSHFGELSGYRLEEVAGQDWFSSFLPEGNRPEMQEIFRAAIGGQATWGKVHPIITRDGQLRDIEWYDRVLTSPDGEITGLLVIGQDVSEREQAQKALRDSEARFRSVVESSPVGIVQYELEPDGRLVIIGANPASDRTLGIRAEEMIGKTIEQAFPALADTELPQRYREIAETGTTWHAEQYAYEDERIHGLYEVRAFQTSPGRTAVMFSDITERKLAEEERLKLEAQIQQTQKLESLGVLAGGIAHDFNNLLMVILGNADIALKDLSDGSPARPGVEEIKRACMRASELTNQMLAYSGRGRFVVKPIDLNELIEEMGHLLQVSISKRVTLQYDLADGLPAVQADASQIQQVVMNLITNASEAIGDETGVIAVRTSVTRLDEPWQPDTYLDQKLPPGTYVALEVSDTGCGMDRQTRAKLFDPFFTTKFAGRGLGLAAVLGIVRGHKGAIQVKSKRGKGSTFLIVLPCLAGVARGAAPAKGEAPETWQGSGTILVADDEEGVRNVARRMLERAGFTILTAADGQEAVEIFAENHNEIVAVLLDMTMPRKSGEDAFAEMHRTRPDVPVILVSGYSEEEATERFAGKGLAGFIQKPYESAALVKKFRRALEP